MSGSSIPFSIPSYPVPHFKEKEGNLLEVTLFAYRQELMTQNHQPSGFQAKKPSHIITASPHFRGHVVWWGHRISSSPYTMAHHSCPSKVRCGLGSG